ncbi:MAG: helix-turn-helix transcriptional regulator [Ruminococcaceae bacterium]|nr:helix-turn-helix transcriptional regulator [Oscillospiraceae bacterium]
MELDYLEIGKRIAKRRKELGLRQVQVCERAGINDKYLSCIERATSIPSLEVIMKLAIALDTTPDKFLVGNARQSDEQWRNVAELLRNMDSRRLQLAKSFLLWLTEQKCSYFSLCQVFSLDKQDKL